MKSKARKKYLLIVEHNHTEFIVAWYDSDDAAYQTAQHNYHATPPVKNESQYPDGKSKKVSLPLR